VASGDWSVVGGGIKNVASGLGSFVGGGGWYAAGGNSGNTASGIGSFIAGGYQNTASADFSSVVGINNNVTGYGATAIGATNTANANFAVAIGNSTTNRSIQGMQSMSAAYSPLGSPVGASQTSILILAKQTTDATATVLTSSSGAASGTNQVILPNNSAYYFRGEVVSGKTGAGDTKGWSIEGVIKRGADAASTTLVGSTVTSLYADAGAATWTIGLTADTTNGGLKVTFTGQASTTIRTVCQLRTTEMTF